MRALEGIGLENTAMSLPRKAQHSKTSLYSVPPYNIRTSSPVPAPSEAVFCKKQKVLFYTELETQRNASPTMVCRECYFSGQI